MKRTVTIVSLAAVLAIGAFAQRSSAKAVDCNDCPMDHCPYCTHTK